MRTRPGWLAAIPIVLACACGTVRTPEQVDSLLAASLDSARIHFSTGHDAEAFQFVSSIERIAPETVGLAELRAQLARDGTRLFERPYLGSNLSLRPSADRSWWARVLLYVPDRVLDFLDIVSFDVHVGLGAYGNLHLTRAIQAGAGFRTVAGFGWHEHRSLGLQSQAEAGLVAVGLGTQAYAGSVLGTSGVVSGGDAMAGLHRPSGVLYRDFRDYWATGAAVTVGVIGIDFDLHPLQLADALAGIFTVDFLHDDLGRTRGLEMTAADVKRLQDLSAVERSEETLEAWRNRGT